MRLVQDSGRTGPALNIWAFAPYDDAEGGVCFGPSRSPGLAARALLACTTAHEKIQTVGARWNWPPTGADLCGGLREALGNWSVRALRRPLETRAERNGDVGSPTTEDRPTCSRCA